MKSKFLTYVAKVNFYDDSNESDRIAAHQVGKIKFNLDVVALKQQLRLDAGLPALGQRRSGLHDKRQALLLDFEEGGALKVDNHVRRHAKEACNAGDLKLAQLLKLRVFVGDDH